MKLSEMKPCHINYRNYEKLRKLSPEIVIGGVDLIKIIEKQNCLLHEFRNMDRHNKLNPKDTNVRDSELWQMIRDCFE